MRASDRDSEFVDFVTAQRTALVRMARLLTAGDDAHAEDLVQTTLTKLYVHWPRVRRAGNPVGYARTSPHPHVRRRAAPGAPPPGDADRRARRDRRPSATTPTSPTPCSMPSPGSRRASARSSCSGTGWTSTSPRPPGSSADLDRHGQVPERQGPRPPPHHSRCRPHLPGAAMNDLNDLLDRAAGPAGAPLDAHADLTRGHRALARTRRRRAAGGLLGVAAAGVVGVGVVRVAGPDRRRRGRQDLESSPRRRPASRSSPSRSRPVPTRSTRRPRAGRSRAPTRRASPSPRSASPTRSPTSFVGKLVILFDGNPLSGEQVELDGRTFWVRGNSGYTTIATPHAARRARRERADPVPRPTPAGPATRCWTFLAGVHVGDGAAARRRLIDQTGRYLTSARRIRHIPRPSGSASQISPETIRCPQASAPDRVHS